MRGRVPHIGDAGDDLHRASFHIISGRDETTQMRSREIGSGGSEAGVEFYHLAVIAGCGADGNRSISRKWGPATFIIARSVGSVGKTMRTLVAVQYHAGRRHKLIFPHLPIRGAQYV